jgi:hypothetical protein
MRVSMGRKVRKRMKSLTASDLRTMYEILEKLDDLARKHDVNFDGRLYACGSSFHITFPDHSSTDVGHHELMMAADVVHRGK